MFRLNSLIRYSTVPWILILFCWLNSHAGVDHGQYLKWAEAAVGSDVYALANEKGITSTTGIPFSPWSSGPGLIIAPFYLAMKPFGLEGGSGLVAGCLCVAIFWISFFHALRHLTNSRSAALGCLLAAVGTPIGYYCCSISSETLSLAPAGYLMWQTVRGLERKPIQWPGLIAATAMLLMIRPFLGVFAWPALLTGFVRSTSRFKFLALASGAVLLAAFQIGITNFWMTGNWMKTPYSFGDEWFKSFDWTAPYLTHVLFDPFHGLLPTHPLTFVGLVGLTVSAFLAAKQKRWLAFSIWLTYLFAAILNVYFQSCWFYWWMAKTSFGMRGLVLCSLPAVLSWIDLRQQCLVNSGKVNVRRQLKSCSLRLFDGLMIALVIWGWLNLCAGPINQTSFWELISVLQRELLSWFSFAGFVALAGSAFLLMSSRLLRESTKSNQEFLTAIIWFLASAIFIRMLVDNWNVTFVIVMVSVWSTMAVGLWNRRQLEIVLAQRAIAIAAGLMLVFFAWLSVDAFRLINEVAAKRGGVVKEAEKVLVFNWPDTRRAYLTLMEIPRLESQKNAIGEFFERNFDKDFLAENLATTLPSKSLEEGGLEVRPVVHNSECQ